MKTLSKICDAGDWFDPEFNEVVLGELKENARFHRKQWEFVMIFLALKKYGFLTEDKIGLSVGGGNERVLYSIANHIKKLVVTDLYDADTSWDCARTGDPTEFILNSKPFPVDKSKITALRMDMRDLQFEDNTFDFCYSSCAVEHIGDFEDFVRHFDEVFRCLKDDGIYVFTTEFQFGKTTIKDPNNYIFSAEYLAKIIDAIKLTLEVNPDVTLISHEANLPLPSNIKNMLIPSKENLLSNLDSTLSHVSLMRGKYPFSSILFILRKKSRNAEKKKVEFLNYSSSQKFLKAGLIKLQDKFNSSEISLNPFSSLPDGISPYCIDHAEYFTTPSLNRQQDDSIFHTDYFWFGSNSRSFIINIESESDLSVKPAVINLRVHSYPVLNSSNIKCIYETDIELSVLSNITEQINIDLDEDYVYAFLAKVKSGRCLFKNLSISSKPIRSEKNSIKKLLGLSNKN